MQIVSTSHVSMLSNVAAGVSKYGIAAKNAKLPITMNIKIGVLTTDIQPSRLVLTTIEFKNKCKNSKVHLFDLFNLWHPGIDWSALK